MSDSFKDKAILTKDKSKVSLVLLLVSGRTNYYYSQCKKPSENSFPLSYREILKNISLSYDVNDHVYSKLKSV